MKLKLILTTAVALAYAFPATASKYKILTSEQPPYVEKQGNDAVGIAVDITKELFKRSNIQYEIVFLPLVSAIRDAKSNEGSCAMPIKRSQDREYHYRWVAPLLVTQSGLFVKQGQPIQLSVLKDVLKYKIGAVRGSDEEDYLKGLGAQVKGVNNDLENAVKLDSGGVNVWSTDTISGQYYADKAGIKVENKISFRTAMRTLACNLKMPDADFEKLDSNLDAMYKDGTIKKIFDKYTANMKIDESVQFLN